MIAGFRRLDSACSSRSRMPPSQLRRKFSAALKTVRVLTGSSRPSGERSRAWRLAPLLRMSWQVEQALRPSPERRGSWKSRAPRATLAGSAGGASGRGVMGSRPVGDGGPAQLRGSEPPTRSRASRHGPAQARDQRMRFIRARRAG